MSVAGRGGAGERACRGAARLAAGAALAAALAGCGRGKEVPCPARFSPDAAREERIVAVLESAGEGAAVKARWGKPVRMCFGAAVTSVVTEDGRLLMDAKLDDRRAAARAAHLLLHLADGLPEVVQGEGECAAVVAQAMTAEARALGLELRLLRELSAPPPEGGAWEVESLYWKAGEEAREGVLLGYLYAHPRGAPGVDGLLAAYSAR